MANQAKVQNISEISCPVLCMVGEGESEEQMAQAREFYDSLKSPKEFRIFTAADGADAHCQINNLFLLHQVLFDWLDRIFYQDAKHPKTPLARLCKCRYAPRPSGQSVWHSRRPVPATQESHACDIPSRQVYRALATLRA